MKKTIEQRSKQALSFAKKRAGSARNWIELHNSLFGIGGKCGELFPTQSDRTRFSGTLEFRKIQVLIESHPGKARAEPAEALARANGRVLLRLPRAVHAALLSEAEAEGVSLNQLCLSKLCLQLRAVVS